jgi:hypothetical protein
MYAIAVLRNYVVPVVTVQGYYKLHYSSSVEGSDSHIPPCVGVLNCTLEHFFNFFVLMRDLKLTSICGVTPHNISPHLSTLPVSVWFKVYSFLDSD